MTISNSTWTIGSVDLRAWIASEYFEKSYFLHNNSVNQIAYDYHTCTLAALHSDFVLTLSRLELLPSNKKFNFCRLHNIKVPVGVKLTQQRSFGDWIVLFQDRTLLSPERDEPTTELTCINTKNGEATRKFIIEKELTQIFNLNGYVLVQKYNQNGIKVYKLFRD